MPDDEMPRIILPILAPWDIQWRSKETHCGKLHLPIRHRAS